MLFIIQFPFADIRQFIDTDTGVLRYPVWPTPIVDQDFVRSVGIARQRRHGGLNGWVSESEICEANNAIRLTGLSPYKDPETGIRIPFRVTYRRFYFDGEVVGKFEVALHIPTLPSEIYSAFSSRQIRDLFYHFLKINVSIPNPLGKAIHCQLWEAGKHLSNLFLASSTNTKYPDFQNLAKWWVQSCKPVLFVEQKRDLEHKFKVPFWGREVLLGSDDSFSLFYHVISIQGQNLSMWRVCQDHVPLRPEIHHYEIMESYRLSDSKSRELRIYLLRLYAERECLKKILGVIAKEQIRVPPHSDVSDKLQSYLNSATRRISRLLPKAYPSQNNDVEQLAKVAEDYVLSGERDAILAALRNLNVRKNVYDKVELFVQQLVIQQNITGDSYSVNQAGAVGPQSHSHDISFS